MGRKLAIGLAVFFTLLALVWLRQASGLAFSEQSDVFQRSVGPHEGEPYAAEMLSLRLRALAAMTFAGALTAFAVLSGRPNPPNIVTALAKLPTTAVICGLLAAFTLMATVILVSEVLEDRAELAREEERMLQIKHELETFEFDSNGQVHPDRRVEFSMLLQDAKSQPSSIAVWRENLQVEGGALAGTLLATIVLGLVAVRSAKKA
jgi:hypothetical protein